ncbi:MAG TPA: biotin carboxylase N-terminal domain-containing protein [Vicinamibacteria bacterium]|nr:biotin carboxylase N-terminal domain-containing protein [Vicinamibacteria bacterium]
MRKLVIANRGEIARRILRTARPRGYAVAVISTATDRDALVRAEADDVLEVPSFLDGEAIARAAKTWGARLLHPGYGFLSENPDFAARVEAQDIVFVGPRPDAMRLLGNKISAKKLAREVDVPTLATVGSDALSRLEAEGIEPPYLVKAAGGGGGRGMRVVKNRNELPFALARASEEARAGFSDATVFVEQLLINPRHVEIQVFGDGKGGGVFLGERECSLQRRYQKVIEEAPSPAVDVELRRQMGLAALRVIERARYRGAGTVEFLLDDMGSFYFLEVNTRLQVEHPVTEAVYGIDLVGCQLELAEGRWPVELPAPSSRGSLEPNGWAIEARVLAEDPRAGFVPTPGPLRRYREPSGRGIRVDSGVAEGGRVHPEFDSLIAKVVAAASTRESAVEQLTRALEEMIVHGPTTNLPFLQSVLRHPEFRAGRFGTRFLEDHLDELNRPLLPPAEFRSIQSRGFRERLSLALRGERPEAEGPFAERFRRLGDVVDLQVDPPTGRVDPLGAIATRLDSGNMALTHRGDTVILEVPRAQPYRRSRVQPADGEVRAPMAGKVLEVFVEEGEGVAEGTPLAVIESMKMQLEVRAPVSGRVEKIHVEPGAALEGKGLLVVISVEGEASSPDSLPHPNPE